MKASEKYINVDDLKRKLNYIFRMYNVSPQMKEVYRNAIEKLPYTVKCNLETTLEAEPVKRGRWKWVDDDPSNADLVCTVCGEIQDCGHFRFCPNCGAKMDLKDGKKMRLIDADELKKYKCDTCDNRERCEDREQVCSDIADIDEQPTIEAEPVKHARWIHHAGMNSKCSCCERYFPTAEFEQRPFDVNFCIYCGARMDGDSK